MTTKLTEAMVDKIDLLNRLMQPSHMYVLSWGHPTKNGHTEWERYTIQIRDKMQSITLEQEFNNSATFHRFLSNKIRLFGQYKEATQ